MTSYKNDHRFDRTEKLIWDIFLSLVSQKGFDKVRVQDIVDESGLSRSGFYLHYEDKYNLLQEIEERVLNKMRSILSDARSRQADEKTISSHELYSYYINLMEYICVHKDWMSALMTIEGDYSFRKKLVTLFEDGLDYSQYINNPPLNSQIPEKYWVSYCINANLGVLETWLDEGCPEQPQKIAEILTLLTTQNKLFSS